MFPILAQLNSVKTDFFRLKSYPIDVPIMLFAPETGISGHMMVHVALNAF